MNPELQQQFPEGMGQSPNMPMVGGPQEEVSPLILVHVSKDEADYLDYMQGGESVNEGTGLREYSKLSSILNSPKFSGFLEDLVEEFQETGKPDKNVKELTKDLPRANKPGFQHTIGDFDPEVQDLEAAGTMVYPEDEELVHMPLDFAKYMDRMRGGATFNPVTGFRQYGNDGSKALTFIGQLPRKIVREAVVRPLTKLGIKETHIHEGIRIGATIVGSTFGPMGTAAGNYYGNWVTGADPKKSAWRGAKMGAAHYAAQTLAGAAGNAFGATQSGANVPTFVNGVQQAAPAATTTAPGAATVPGGFNLANVLPYAGIAGLVMKGTKDDRKLQKEAEEEHRREIDKRRQEMGWNDPFRTWASNPRELNDEEQSPEDIKAGREHSFYKPMSGGRYAHGGRVHEGHKLLPGEDFVQESKYVRGPGTGQSDDIPINLPEGSWIVDSSAVSALGDGSSDRGAEVLDKLTSKLRHLSKSHTGKLEIPKRRVPALLSDGEYVINTPEVSLLGHGSNKQGTKYLKDWTESIRTHKISKGDQLPPKAKKAEDYFPKTAKRILNAI